MARAKPITGLDAQAPTGINAVDIARIRLEELFQWKSAVDLPYAVRELHNLRIAAKRLRYTLEIFAEFLPEDCKAIVAELEQMQNELGALHDSDVMIALLRLCLGSQEGTFANQNPSESGAQKKRKTKSFIDSHLLSEMLNPAVAPTAGERDGLEWLLRKQEQTRKEQYQAFRQHWYHLQEQNVYHRLFDLLDQERDILAVS